MSDDGADRPTPPEFPFEGVFPLPSPFGHERGIPTRPRVDTGQTPRRRQSRRDRKSASRRGEEPAAADPAADAGPATALDAAERFLAEAAAKPAPPRPPQSVGPFHREDAAADEPSGTVPGSIASGVAAPPGAGPGLVPRDAALAAIEGFFASRGWGAFPFQREVWEAYLAGRSGLLHATTGAGKTLAVWLGPVAEMLLDGWEESPAPLAPDGRGVGGEGRKDRGWRIEDRE